MVHNFATLNEGICSFNTKTLTANIVVTRDEGTISFDERIKLWMINDKPGIIAKVIFDREGSFGHYNVLELVEIK